MSNRKTNPTDAELLALMNESDALRVRLRDLHRDYADFMRRAQAAGHSDDHDAKEDVRGDAYDFLGNVRDSILYSTSVNPCATN